MTVPLMEQREQQFLNGMTHTVYISIGFHPLDTVRVCSRQGGKPLLHPLMKCQICLLHPVGSTPFLQTGTTHRHIHIQPEGYITL